MRTMIAALALLSACASPGDCPPEWCNREDLRISGDEAPGAEPAAPPAPAPAAPAPAAPPAPPEPPAPPAPEPEPVNADVQRDRDIANGIDPDTGEPIGNDGDGK